eukprot:sb/3472965/
MPFDVKLHALMFRIGVPETGLLLGTFRTISTVVGIAIGGYLATKLNLGDVDECLGKPCSHNCVNTLGSFYCTCPVGMELNEDGLNCDSDQYFMSHHFTPLSPLLITAHSLYVSLYLSISLSLSHSLSLCSSFLPNSPLMLDLGGGSTFSDVAAVKCGT